MQYLYKMYIIIYTFIMYIISIYSNKKKTQWDIDINKLRLIFRNPDDINQSCMHAFSRPAMLRVYHFIILKMLTMHSDRQVSRELWSTKFKWKTILLKYTWSKIIIFITFIVIIYWLLKVFEVVKGLAGEGDSDHSGMNGCMWHLDLQRWVVFYVICD